ncbi:membrane fusion protein, Cu(I)/Ag(I) efflux system [Catalinimonas alkaloidigena]|uniref:Membrane fusion protein, Cu(I)/Ag(I) efflux system n=1 Tax=Catalinimonas alkaloidigena TaxID=1075417 RepID=A0A1G9VM50_9BACT|nr:DUF3347 domain-containing protein [Catalinimonas alkaloidigena]SDM73186.1 membrane fusion protein, Cu(I)/Ag(I) efflux system [Catalinimonas alkaloidigena]
MKKQTLVAALIALSGFALPLRAQHQHHATPQSQTPTTKIDADFQQQLATVYLQSQSLLKAFVNSDAAQVQQTARDVEKALSQVNMKLLSGNDHMSWMQQVKTLQNSLQQMSARTDLTAQRQQLDLFSETLYQSIKQFGIGEQTVYYQHCPMAREGKGGYWLSAQQAIQNPYFGQKMLTCGSTKEVLP